jgi:hypothetical protein
VVGKPVHTVLLPAISRDNQEGTLHFRYLLTVNGGLLRVARSLDEHLELLAGSLAGEGSGDEKAACFVKGFVRPFGLDEPATPRFVAAIEAAMSMPAPTAQPATWAVWATRPLLAAAVFVVALARGPHGGWASVGQLGMKRGRRAVRRASYESMRAVEGVVARIRRPIVRGARYAGRVARRAAGRQA